MGMGGHVGDLELQRLKMFEPLAEGGAILQVGDRALHGALQNTEPQRTDQDTPGAYVAQGLLEPRALFAE
ncbi:hypothetical protein D9M71_735050 [compost metagenome]